MAKKIGVFSGTFDPVHRGHIESCVVALGVAELDTVVLLLEKKPHRKTEVADFKDRANMLELATMDYPSLRVVDLRENNVNVDNTLEYLEDQFPGGEYWYIFGSDILDHIEDWPGSKKLFKNFSLCIVLRDNSELEFVKEKVAELKEKHPDTKIGALPSVWSPVSSSTVKETVRKGEIDTGLDPAVREYIRRHKLYS